MLRYCLHRRNIAWSSGPKQKCHPEFAPQDGGVLKSLSEFKTLQFMKIFTGMPERFGVQWTPRQRAKVRLVMKISFVYVALIIASGLLVQAHAGLGQNLDKRVSIGMNNESIQVLYKKLYTETGFTFVFDEAGRDFHVTFPEVVRSAKETLELALQGSDMTYRVVGKAIVIIKKDEATTIEKEPEAVNTVEEKDGLAVFTVTGTIIDASTQMPMPGVNIIVKGTTRGTSSDSNGKFSIDAEKNETLVFSFIGFKTFEIEVGDRTTINVELQTDATALKEIEVRSTGYWTDTKERSTGNIAKVSAKDIEKQPVTSPLMALQGRMAGVDITPNSGAAGGAIKIQVRGQNSLRYDGGFPLYVIDGVPIDSRPIESSSLYLMAPGFDPLSNINPANIESIEVLKDGQATSIYGSRGANGVIVIKTKDAKTSGKTDVDMSFYSGVGDIGHQLDLLNTPQYLEMRREAYANDGTIPEGSSAYDLLLWDTTRYTNWQEKLLGGSANITDAQVGISAGNENTSFRLGAGAHTENTIYPGDFGFKRFTGNFSLNHWSDNKKLLVTLALNFGRNNNRLFNDGNYVYNALTLPPNAPRLYTDNGELNWEINPGNGFFSWINPLSYLKMTHEASTGTLFANSSVSYEIIDGLRIKTNLGYNELNSTELLKSPIAAQAPQLIIATSTGSATFRDTYRKSWIVEPQLSYLKKFGSSNLNIVIGATFQDSYSYYQAINGTGYSSDALLDSPLGAGAQTYTTDAGEYRYQSLLARIGYDYKNRYLIDIIGRRDGSSRFGPGNRFGNFAGVGVGWIFSKEKLIEEYAKFISFGKIRGSYASTGNDQIGDYKFYNTYSVSPNKYRNATALYPDALYNPDFQWEVTKKLEAGIEMSFFQNRFSFELSWYRNRSSNQLTNYTLPGTTGFTSILSNLNATVENTGYEAELNIAVLDVDDFHWSTSVNFSVPKNKLIEFPGLESSPYATVYKVGEPLTIQRLYVWNGVDPETGLHVISDENGDGSLDDSDKKFMKPLGRKYYGGILNTLAFKRFELSFLLQFSKHIMRDYLPGVYPGRPHANQITQVLDRWQNDGDQTSVAKFSADEGVEIYYGSYVVMSNLNTLSASFLRLKTLTLSYSVPSAILDRIRLKEAKLYVQGQNLFTHSDFIGLDPETGSYTIPPLRMITGGLSLKF